LNTSYVLRIACKNQSFNTALLIAKSKEKNAPAKKSSVCQNVNLKVILGLPILFTLTK
jgi:hypothetical protein